MGLLWLGIVWSLAMFGFVAEKTFDREPAPNHEPAPATAQASPNTADNTHHAPQGIQAEVLKR